MDFGKLLKEAGYNVSDAPVKVDSKNANLKSKVDSTERFVKNLDEYINHINGVPDKEIYRLVQNSVVLNFERFCISVKDLLDIIATKENINLSNKRGLGELIRNTASLFGLNDRTINAINKLTTRNDVAHDYMNADYYDDVVVSRVANDIEEYKMYVNKIKEYLIENKMI